MSNRVFPIFITLLLLLGIYLGWFLASRPSFSIPALLNVAGNGYSILAVIVLYEAVAQDEKLKRVIVSYVAPFLLWAHTLVPLSVSGGQLHATLATMRSAKAGEIAERIWYVFLRLT